MSRQAIIVLGMHRSGTSALTGALARLGLALPRHPLADAADNPEGFYESQRVVNENFKILTAQRCAWNVTFTLEPAALQAATPPETFAALHEVLHGEFGDTGCFVLKDPRLCLLLPLWFPGLRRLAAVQRVLLMARHPAEVVRSHMARNECAEDEVLLNWLHHMLEAETMTRKLRRAVLTFDDLIRDSNATLRTALSTAGITTPRTLQDAAPEIARFITPAMRHHAAAGSARIGPAHLAKLVEASWHAFLALARNPLDAFALAALDDARGNFSLIRQDMIRQGLRARLPPGL